MNKFKFLMRFIGYFIFILVLGVSHQNFISSLPAQEVDHELNFRNLIKDVKKKYPELDSYVETVALALLAGEHVLAFGPAGGAKTGLVRDILKEFEGKFFELQFSAATGQDQIVGSVVGKKLIEEGVRELNSERSLVMSELALLDELDKALKEILSSALSVLNERKVMQGASVQEGKLKTAIATSNKTIEELIEEFSRQGQESTAFALMDRFLFKTFVPNRMVSDENMLLLTDCKSKVCTSPNRINLQEIQSKIDQIKIPKEVERLFIQLWNRMTKDFERKEIEERELAQRMCSPSGGSQTYRTRQAFSNRGYAKQFDILKRAYFLHKGNKKINWENPTLEVRDLKYAAMAMIMQGPGKINVDSVESPEGVHIRNLAEKYQVGSKERKVIDDIIYERQVFARNYQELLKGYQEELKLWAIDDILGMTDVTSVSKEEKSKILVKLLELKKRVMLKTEAKFKEAGLVKPPEKDDSDDDDEKEIVIVEMKTPDEVARKKILEEIAEWEKLLEVSSVDSAAAIELVEKKLKEETERLAQEKLKREKEEKEAEEELSRRVQTTTGAVYVEVNHPLIGKAWRDPRGLLWSHEIVKDKVSGNKIEMNWKDAFEYCLNLNPPEKREEIRRQIQNREDQLNPLRLEMINERDKIKIELLTEELRKKSREYQPTIRGCYLPNREEYEELVIDMGYPGKYSRQIISDVENRMFWSSSHYPERLAAGLSGAFFFNGNYGHLNWGGDYTAVSVRPVCRP
jgi:MoxR-like ATPase